MFTSRAYGAPPSRPHRPSSHSGPRRAARIRRSGRRVVVLPEPEGRQREELAARDLEVDRDDRDGGNVAVASCGSPHERTWGRPDGADALAALGELRRLRRQATLQQLQASIQVDVVDDERHEDPDDVAVEPAREQDQPAVASAGGGGRRRPSRRPGRGRARGPASARGRAPRRSPGRAPCNVLEPRAQPRRARRPVEQLGPRRPRRGRPPPRRTRPGCRRTCRRARR